MDNGPERRSSKAFITWDVSSAPDGTETQRVLPLFALIVFLHCSGFFLGEKIQGNPLFLSNYWNWENLFLLPEVWSNDPIPRLFPKRSEVRSEQRYQASKFGRFRVWEFCCLGNFDSNSGFLPLNRNIQDRNDSNPRGVLFYFPGYPSLT